MKYATVVSTTVEAIGYDEATNTLSVLFLKNKSAYFYAGVPKEVFDLFLAAESKGTFFNQAVKGSYVYFKLEQVELFPEGTLDTVKTIQECVNKMM